VIDVKEIWLYSAMNSSVSEGVPDKADPLPNVLMEPNFWDWIIALALMYSVLLCCRKALILGWNLAYDANRFVFLSWMLYS